MKRGGDGRREEKREEWGRVKRWKVLEKKTSKASLRFQCKIFYSDRK
jgi:hypothetical protein